MTLTLKDKIALPTAIFLSAVFGFLSAAAGYGGVFVASFYGALIVPLVVLYVADQRKLLVWQACIVPFALWIASGWRSFGVFLLFWTAGTVISSPVVIFLYWKRSEGRIGHQVRWLFVGLTLVGLVCGLLRDPFLFCGLAIFWIVLCLVKAAWEWHRATEHDGPKTTTLFAALVFTLTISTASLVGVSFKQQAFRSAMNHDYFWLARLFTKIGADPNGRDSMGETALVDAAWNGVGDLPAVNTLIALGANVNQEQTGALHGMVPSGTALHVAASAGRTEICESLLRAGASVDAKNGKGATPLLVALSHASIACVPVLLEHGANVNASDMQGRTALMFLTNYGPDDPAIQSILRELLTKGADVNAKDAAGKTANDWATYYQHEKFAEQLRSLGESRPQAQ